MHVVLVAKEKHRCGEQPRGCTIQECVLSRNPGVCTI